MSLGNMRVTALKEVEKSPISGHCCAAIRKILGLVGDKWSMLVVGILSDQPLRFNELRRRVDGISQRMLTRTLRELERNGLVTRKVEASVPPSVEYSLTSLGVTLLTPVHNLIFWTQQHYPEISAAQQLFESKKS